MQRGSIAQWAGFSPRLGALPSPRSRRWLRRRRRRNEDHRNSPRARKERAVAKRFLRLHRLTERELIALPYSRLTPMPGAYKEWRNLARRLFLFAGSWRLHHQGRIPSMGRPMKDLNPFGRPSSAPCSRSSSCAAGRRKASHSRSICSLSNARPPTDQPPQRPARCAGRLRGSDDSFGLAFNVCPDRKRGDTRSNAIGLVQFQRLRKEHPESYCARCAGEQPAPTPSATPSCGRW